MTKIGSRDGHYTVKKLTVDDKVPVSYTIAHCAETSTTAILAGWDVSAGTAAKTNIDFSAQPPYPMVLSVNAVAAGTADDSDTLLFKGYDATGKYIEENVVVSSTAGTSTAAHTYTNNAFSYLISVEPDDALHKSTDVNIGWRAYDFGLPYPIATSDDVIAYTTGSTHATTAPYTVNVAYNRISDSNLGAGSSVRVLYLSRFQE